MSPWAIGVLYLLASALTASSSFSTSTPWTAQASATVSPPPPGGGVKIEKGIEIPAVLGYTN